MKFRSRNDLKNGWWFVIIATAIILPMFILWRHAKYNFEDSDKAQIHDRVISFYKGTREPIIEFKHQGNLIVPAYFTIGKKRSYLCNWLEVNDSIYKPEFSDSLWLFKQNGETIGFVIDR